jgi:anti-sigma regulatory factor (Ser/Thr protein kinase)
MAGCGMSPRASGYGQSGVLAGRAGREDRVHQAGGEDLHLPAEPIAVAVARAGIRDAAAGLPDQVVADLMLLTSEVVSNAIRHVPHDIGDEIILRIAVDETVRVEVVDSGELFAPPSPHQPFDTPTSGWGLPLVNAVARSWGVEPEEGNGKKVWFELGRE